MSKKKTTKQFIEEARLVHGNKYLGYYDTPEEAFNIYKVAKEKYIKSVAETLFKEEKITKKVYDALISYKVEISD